MTLWCSVHPSVFQGSHLLQGWVFANKEQSHGSVPEEAPASATPSRVFQPGVFRRSFRPELPLCRRWAGCRSPLLGFAPVPGRMSSKVWVFWAHPSLALVTELSAGRRCVLSFGTCGCGQSVFCYITVCFFS